jgi:small-conductance mechanosensitive channel
VVPRGFGATALFEDFDVLHFAEPVVQKIEGLIEGFFWLLPNLGIAAVVFLAFLAAGSVVRRTVLRISRRRHRDDLGGLLAGAARWSLIVLGLLVVATIVFPSIKPADLLSALGIGTVAVGFAFRDILQNWLSGLLILYRQPFKRGDQIRSGEFEGTVDAIEARATLIRTYDGQQVVIPNSDIYTRAITVRTAFPARRSQCDVGVGYGDDIGHACEVIVKAMQGMDGVAADPAPDALPWSFDSSSVTIRARWWSGSRRSDVVHAQARVIPAIRGALAEAGIDMPFPTRVVLLHDQTEDIDGDRARQREGWPAHGTPPRPRHLNDVHTTVVGRKERESVERGNGS